MRLEKMTEVVAASISYFGRKTCVTLIVSLIDSQV